MNLTFNYTGSGGQQITAQIIDSVLYDASDSATVNFAAPVTTLTLSAPSRTGENVTFNWSGGSGNFTVHYKKTSASSYSTACTSNSTTCGPVSIPSGAAYTAYVDDTNGDKSSDVTF
jgi:hypothetical protein